MRPDDLEELISPARFATFVRLASGDRVAATELYLWTGQLAGALFTDYRHLEVIFRNHVDSALSSYAESLVPTTTTWLDDSWLPEGTHGWDDDAKGVIRSATRRAKRGRRPPPHGAVIAELSFGFWRYIIHGRYEEAFWLPALDKAFVGVSGDASAADRRRTLEVALIDLHKLRNRIAHHEPICKPTTRMGPGDTPLALKVEDAYETLLKVLDWTSPAASAKVQETSNVPSLLATRPV